MEKQEFFLKLHIKDEDDEKKVAYYVCFEVASSMVAFKKLDSLSVAKTFLQSICNRDVIPFDVNTMQEFRAIALDELEDVKEEEVKTEETKSDTYTPGVVQRRCIKCAFYYEPWGMCKISGGYADSIKACTAFKEIGRR